MSALRHPIPLERPLLLALVLTGCFLAWPTLGLEVVVPSAAIRGHDRYSYGYNSDDGFSWSGERNQMGCLVSPIDLEDYDEILAFSADLLDDDPIFDFSLELRRHSVTDPAASAEVVARVSSSGASTSIHRVSTPIIYFPIVNADLYVYYVTTLTCLMQFDDDHRVYGVRVETALIFADGFESGNTAAWGSGPGGNTSGTFVLTVPGAAFHYSDDDSTVSEGWFDPDGGYRRVTTSPPPGGITLCEHAAVQLPQGATISLVDSALYDNTPDTNLTVNLRRKAFTNATASTVIATLQTSGSSTGMQYPSDGVDAPVVDNNTYAYYFEVCSSTYLTPGHTFLRIYDTRFFYRR